MDYFARELQDYFAARGGALPPGVLDLLGKPLSHLNPEEMGLYNRQVGPYLENFRMALARRFTQRGLPWDEWMAEIGAGERSIAGELASQAIGLTQPISLPRFISPDWYHPIHPLPPSPREKARSKVILILLVAFVVLCLASMAGLSTYYIYTASHQEERLLQQAEREKEQGDYRAAAEHLRQLTERYPMSAEAREAEELYPGVVMDYILSRVESLKREVPEPVVKCVANLRYLPGYDPLQQTQSTYDPQSNAITINVWEIYLEYVDNVVLHEWGHVYDQTYIDAREELEYKRLRGIPADAPWICYNPEDIKEEDYLKSVGEDFAEAFVLVIGGRNLLRKPYYGWIDNPSKIREWMLQAARN